MAQPQPQREKDPVRVDPQHYTVDQENERVRVLRCRYAPHEKSVMHSHPALVAVFLNDCRFRMTTHDGKSEVREMRAGQVYYVEPEEHLPENLADGTAEIILIELKG